MFHILELGIFPENMTRFYGAEITLAIGYLHSLKIIYRDVKVYYYTDLLIIIVYMFLHACMHAIKVVVASLCF